MVVFIIEEDLVLIDVLDLYEFKYRCGDCLRIIVFCKVYLKNYNLWEICVVVVSVRNLY